MNYSNHDCRVRPGLRKIRGSGKVRRKLVDQAGSAETVLNTAKNRSTAKTLPALA
jgi:hypothetical protein